MSAIPVSGCYNIHIVYTYTAESKEYDFSKALSRLSSSGDYKRTQQGALTILILYIYYRLLVHATTIITYPYVHALSSCPITHPHVFSLRLLCFLHVPWCHTLNLCYICAHHKKLMSLNITPNPNSFSRLFLILLDPKSFQTALDSIIWLLGHVLISHLSSVVD